jgi:hypothetical protein
LLFLTNEIISLQAKSPVKKAARKPTDNSPTLIVDNKKSSLIISFAIFPKIKGTTIRKENLAAFDLSIPNNTEVAIVAPDLDMPGKIAIA